MSILTYLFTYLITYLSGQFHATSPDEPGRHKTVVNVSSCSSVSCPVASNCVKELLWNAKYIEQEAQLSQKDRAAACLNFDKNISANSVHLTLLYIRALTSTNDHFTAPSLYLMQN